MYAGMDPAAAGRSGAFLSIVGFSVVTVAMVHLDLVKIRCKGGFADKLLASTYHHAASV